MEQAIRRMTVMPAVKFGLKDLGVIRTGAYADPSTFRSCRDSGYRNV
jgi:N-acyl-D-aspartate/D-glutamate deacylase